jgi:hypothetical protein
VRTATGTLAHFHPTPENTACCNQAWVLKNSELPSYFQCLIPEYPDTLSLKMYAYIQELNRRPHFELEPSEHPLSQEYNKGINAERVKKIMMERLRGNE